MDTTDQVLAGEAGGRCKRAAAGLADFGQGTRISVRLRETERNEYLLANCEPGTLLNNLKNLFHLI